MPITRLNYGALRPTLIPPKPSHSGFLHCYYYYYHDDFHYTRSSSAASQKCVLCVQCHVYTNIYIHLIQRPLLCKSDNFGEYVAHHRSGSIGIRSQLHAQIVCACSVLGLGALQLSGIVWALVHLFISFTSLSLQTWPVAWESLDIWMHWMEEFHQFDVFQKFFKSIRQSFIRCQTEKLVWSITCSANDFSPFGKISWLNKVFHYVTRGQRKIYKSLSVEVPRREHNSLKIMYMSSTTGESYTCSVYYEQGGDKKKTSIQFCGSYYYAHLVPMSSLKYECFYSLWSWNDDETFLSFQLFHYSE